MLNLYLKRWTMFFIITVFSLIIGLRSSMAFFHLFFWFLVSIAVINLAWVLIAYFGIRLYLARTTINKIQEDDVLEIKALIRNNSFLPAFNMVLEDYLSCADSKERKKLFLIEYLGARSSLNIRYNCLCPLRGKYRIGPFAVYFFDPLGLFFLKRTYYVYSELYVYPWTCPIRNFPTLVKGGLPWFGIETTRVSGDEDEFFGVREYKEGDPLKRIHWISSARKNTLIVKQFQRQSFFSATIIFTLEKDKNFGEGKERIAEYIIKIAASLSKYFLERGISLEIIVHAGEIVHIPFNKGPEHLEDIFRFLATAQAESRVGLGEIFEEFSRYIPNDSSIIVIMLDIDQDYLQPILLLGKRNISVIPLILVSSTFLYPHDERNLLKDVKIKISPISNLKPLYFCQGDNLEEAFVRY
jgi:uncharacterized protein (DUF58 family)